MFVKEFGADVRLKLEIAIVSNESGKNWKNLYVRLKLEIAIVSNNTAQLNNERL